MNMVPEEEEKIKIMRTIAQTLQASDQDLLIRYVQKAHGSNRPIYCLATALPQSTTPRGNGEPLAKRRCHGPTLGHCRWIVSDSVGTETSCNVFNCSYVSESGPVCVCAENRSPCSLSCHIELESLSRCASRRHFERRGEGGELPDNCSLCYASKIESLGEDFCFLRRTELQHLDEWHFMLSDSVIYDFLLGDRGGVSIFKKNNVHNRRCSPNELGCPASLQVIEAVLANSSLDVEKIRSYLEDWWRCTVDGDSSVETQQSPSFKALVFARELYESFKGPTINIEVVKRPLYDATWAQWASNSGVRPRRRTPGFCVSPLRPHVDQPQSPAAGSTPKPPSRPSSPPLAASPLRTPQTPSYSDSSLYETYPPNDCFRDAKASTSRFKTYGNTILNTSSWYVPLSEEQLPNNQSRLAASLACITMFETGEFNIHPETLQEVMILSTGDSIYVASGLVSDPSEDTNGHPIRRVFGNLGRPEMAFPIPPSNPKFMDYELKSWHLINHAPFNGQFEDNFQSTSLHLSFTDFEMPVDVGVRGLRDRLVILVESLVSINDKGRHVGDLDIISMLDSKYVTLMGECSH